MLQGMQVTIFGTLPGKSDLLLLIYADEYVLIVYYEDLPAYYVQLAMNNTPTGSIILETKILL